MKTHKLGSLIPLGTRWEFSQTKGWRRNFGVRQLWGILSMAFLVMNGLPWSIPIAIAAVVNECVIDLNNNSHTCQGVTAISFVSSPASNRALIKLSFDPARYSHNQAVFEVSYDKAPTGWTVDICDSQSCDGYGGDAGHTSNAAEVQIRNTGLNVYSNTLTGYQTQTLDGLLNLLNKANVVNQGDTISLEVSNERLGWKFPTDQGSLASKYLFTLNGQATLYGAVDYDVYAAFNRVITGRSDRNGSGASLVRIKLVKQEINSPSNLLDAVSACLTKRIIVNLKAPFQPEGLLATDAEVQAQRTEIARVQEQFTSSLWSVYQAQRGLRSIQLPTPISTKEEFVQFFGITSFSSLPSLVMQINDLTILDKIVQNPLVAGIEVDFPMAPALDKSVEQVGAKNVWPKNGSTGFSGDGYTVAILDSGVDYDHPALKGKMVKEACFSTNGTNVSSLCPNGDVSDENSGSGKNCLTYPGCEHGTHVAGIVAANGSIQGVAKDAKIFPIQVFSSVSDATECTKYQLSSPCPLAYYADLIKALVHVYSKRFEVANIAAVNVSIASTKSYLLACDTNNPAMKDAIVDLRSVGIATVIASGNDYMTGEIAFPACISSAISVGATTDLDTVTGLDTVTDYSNIAYPDKFPSFLLAPGGKIGNGLGILSTIPGGGTKEDHGTSMATPHVAGAFAILRQKLDGEENLDKTSVKHPLNKVVDIIQAALTVSATPITTRKGTITLGSPLPRIQIDKALAFLNYHLYMGIGNSGEDIFPTPSTTTGCQSGALASEMTWKYLDTSTDSCTNTTTDLTADEVVTTLNGKVHVNNVNPADGNYDYNYGHVADTNLDNELKTIVYWMDCLPEGGKNAPALVPINGSYEGNWRILRGVTTNDDTRPCTVSSNNILLNTTQVTGFLLNNPMASSNSEYYVYQSVKAFKDTYKQLSDGQYHAVLEPPLEDLAAAQAALAKVQMTFAAPKPNPALRDFLSVSQPGLRSAIVAREENHVAPMAMVKEAIPGELLVNPLVQPLVNQANYVRSFIVADLDTGIPYALFALGPTDNETATVLVEIDPMDGAFASATWTAQAQPYPTVSATQASQVAMQNAKAGDQIATIRPVWSAKLGTSRFSFNYEVTLTTGKTVYINGHTAKVIDPNPPVTLQVTKTGTGTGEIRSGDNAINCGVTCQANYPFNSLVTLTANPATGSTFTAWTGGCSGNSATLQVSMDAAKTCTATFTLIPGAISGTVWKDLNGDGVRQANEPSANAVNVFLKYLNLPELIEITNTSGTYKFVDLTLTGQYTLYVGTDKGWIQTSPATPAYYEIPLTTGQQVTNKDFGIAPAMTLTVTKTGTGEVMTSEGLIKCGTRCQATYPINQKVTLTAVAAKGAVFSGWGGACKGVTPCAVTLSQAQTVTATFQPVFTLTVKKSGLGVVNSTPAGINCGLDCTEDYLSGTLVKLTAAANPGNIFVGWSGGGCTGKGTCQVKMSQMQMVTAGFKSMVLPRPPVPYSASTGMMEIVPNQ